VVSFEDTNLVGNVYFANFIRWQGKCREFFIKDNAPVLLEEIEKNDLALITMNCSCQYLAELKAFDQVLILMSLEAIQQNKVKMLFEYYKVENGTNKKVAIGTHEIGCFRRHNNELTPVPVPDPLSKVLEEYKK
jgi:enediyne biosynthesis thioesterase